jgi:sugar-phosphate isomerases, RpiB/LacA/LacB family
MTKIFFAADHAGFKFKERLKKYAASLGYEPIDAGAFSIAPADDYPDFIVPAVRAAVATGAKAVVTGGSGLGECIVANKVKGARAAACFDAYTAKMARRDNDANVLCLGGRTSVAKHGVAEKILKIWLATKFSGAARHKRRLKKIAALEK